MDLGKVRFPIGSAYNGDSNVSLQDIYTTFSVLQIEFAKLPGTCSIVASAAVTAGKAVNITGGQVKHADAATNLPAVGICVRSAAIGQKAEIIMMTGYIPGLGGLTANTNVYLGNAGALLFAKPGAGFIQGLGYALSTTELFVNISNP